ncbi:MAG: DegT/DnrJ/EryC1/StrS family aminotransferase [Actinomycetota bacterium]|nr:DegT/DnrJ/EryC1/StrS family aminotransferase [Actinomycetota bacterium]
MIPAGHDGAPAVPVQRADLIPVNAPVLGDREAELVMDCLRSGWISSAGRYIEEFEDGWARRCGREYGISVSNGTTALQLAVASCHLERGSEIIMPSFTIISCALAAVYNGCKPVLVDCDPETWCMDVGDVESKITPRTAAIMPVHIYGHPVDMDPLLAIAKQRALAVTEDAAEAHGATYLSGHAHGEGSWTPCGGMGDVSTFSFYANKLVTTGEGGMVVTDDDDIAERARSLRNLAFQSDPRFVHEELGFNFRLTNLQAAIGVAQLERFDEVVARKREIARLYAERLRGIEGLQLPHEEDWARSVYWMYGIVLRESLALEATDLARRLAALGIETRPFFMGIHEQPVFKRRGWFLEDRHTNTERIARRGLYLPSGVGLTEDQIDRVAEAVDQAVAA